ncbi:MAG: hypothetical protein IPJ77_23655 [Planctomycetes bacterium]|nr:hypothetical protein [Planctomycetota bacterium]
MPKFAGLVVLVLVLAGLGAWFVLRAEPGAPVDAPAASVTAGTSSTSGAAELERPVAAPEVEAAPSVRRERADEAPPLDGFHVHGRLIEPDGTRVSGREAGLYLRNASGIELYMKPRGDGSFSIGPMDAGAYELVAREPDHVSAKTKLELAGDYARVQKDLVLAPWRRITVRVRDLEGEPLAPKLMSSREWGYRWPLTAVAYSEEPPVSGLDPNETVAKGIGEYQGIGQSVLDPEREESRPVWDRDAAPRDAIGEFRVRALPVYVALSLQGTRVGVVRVQPGEHEARFEVDPEALRARTTSLRLRVVSGATNEPIGHAWVVVVDSVDDARQERWDGELTRVGRDGVFRALGVEAGDRVVIVGCEGWPTVVHAFTILPGTPLDLGDVALPMSMRIRGRVRGLDGSLVPARLALEPIEVGAGEPRTRRFSSGENGFVQENLAPGVYELRWLPRVSELAQAEWPKPDLDRYMFEWTEEEWRSSLALHGAPIRIDVRREDALDVDVVAAPARRVEFVFEPRTLGDGSEAAPNANRAEDGRFPSGRSRGDVDRLVLSTREGSEVASAWVSRDQSSLFVWIADGDYRVHWEVGGARTRANEARQGRAPETSASEPRRALTLDVHVAETSTRFEVR